MRDIIYSAYISPWKEKQDGKMLCINITAADFSSSIKVVWLLQRRDREKCRNEEKKKEYIGNSYEGEYSRDPPSKLAWVGAGLCCAACITWPQDELRWLMLTAEPTGCFHLALVLMPPPPSSLDFISEWGSIFLWEHPFVWHWKWQIELFASKKILLKKKKNKTTKLVNLSTDNICTAYHDGLMLCYLLLPASEGT